MIKQDRNKIGKRYGNLTVIEIDPTRKYPKMKQYLCKCDCGNIVSRSSNDLRVEQQSSCKSKDCIFDSRLKHPKGQGVVHPLYGKYKSMMTRCHKPNHRTYQGYGSRGISVCKDWREDYLTFFNWAINSGWKEKLSLDRINPDGNYEPSNCRWIPLSQQTSTSRRSIAARERTIKVKELKDQGYTNPEIEKILNANKNQIKSSIEKLGIGKYKSSREETAALDKKVQELRDQGVKRPEICRLLDKPLHIIKDSYRRTAHGGTRKRNMKEVR